MTRLHSSAEPLAADVGRGNEDWKPVDGASGRLAVVGGGRRAEIPELSAEQLAQVFPPGDTFDEPPGAFYGLQEWWFGQRGEVVSVYERYGSLKVGAPSLVSDERVASFVAWVRATYRAHALAALASQRDTLRRLARALLNDRAFEAASLDGRAELLAQFAAARRADVELERDEATERTAALGYELAKLRGGPEGFAEADYPSAILSARLGSAGATQHVVLEASSPREYAVVFNAIAETLARVLPTVDWHLDLLQLAQGELTEQLITDAQSIYLDWYHDALYAFRDLEAAGLDPTRLEDLRCELLRKPRAVVAWVDIAAFAVPGADVRSLLTLAIERLMTWLADREDAEHHAWDALRWAAHARLLREDSSQPTEQELGRLLRNLIPEPALCTGSADQSDLTPEEISLLLGQGPI